MRHDIHKTKEYFAWLDMRKRCLSPASKDYARYGGRGITICKRWSSFALFLEDVGIAPSKKHSLDRIEVNGNYEPGNIRWATAKEQANNRANSLSFVVDGKRISLKDLAKQVGVPYPTAWHRVVKQGMGLNQALRKDII